MGGVLALIGGAILLLRRRPGHDVKALSLAAMILAVLTVGFAIANAHGAASTLNQARRGAVASRAGLEHCLTETNGEAGPALAARRPFMDWVKRRLPTHAVYVLAPYAGPPDVWCVTLMLLPSLPAIHGERAGWTIAFGTMPPDLLARLARHDPTVSVFAPGFALAKEGGR